MIPDLRTDRLVLRGFRDEDRAPFAALNADPVVMEHFPSTLDRTASDAFVDRIAAGWEERGWGLWAVEVVEAGGVGGAVDAGGTVEAGPAGFIGYVGLWPADFVAPGTVEVGWRLAHGAWGNGYAPEAAAESLRFGFEDLGLDEIVSFTVRQNLNSRRVMEKIGLHRRPERDFAHPNVDAEAHPHLSRHVLYALGADEWRARRRPTDSPAK